jgi:hypothetical protein
MSLDAEREKSLFKEEKLVLMLSGPCGSLVNFYRNPSRPVGWLGTSHYNSWACITAAFLREDSRSGTELVGNLDAICPEGVELASYDVEPFECSGLAYLGKITVGAFTVAVVGAGEINHPLWNALKRLRSVLRRGDHRRRRRNHILRPLKARPRGRWI